jgi:hypothetical protein
LHFCCFLQTEVRGTTGVTRFDNEGFRSNLVLDIVELTYDGLMSIGTWNSSDGVNLTRIHQASIQEGIESLQNKTFIVMTALVREQNIFTILHKLKSLNIFGHFFHSICFLLVFSLRFKVELGNRRG